MLGVDQSGQEIWKIIRCVKTASFRLLIWTASLLEVPVRNVVELLVFCLSSIQHSTLTVVVSIIPASSFDDQVSTGFRRWALNWINHPANFCSSNPVKPEE